MIPAWLQTNASSVTTDSNQSTDFVSQTAKTVVINALPLIPATSARKDITSITTNVSNV